ncbi:hypothetical protein PMAYCL1PPCAC_19643, partial [Pristionchus mayeri]
LSRMPDLCLLEIFKNLKRMDICSVASANRRICSMCDDPSLDRVKWNKAQLSLFQIENGYSFSFDPCPDESDLEGAICVYQYQITYSEMGKRRYS